MLCSQRHIVHHTTIELLLCSVTFQKLLTSTFKHLFDSFHAFMIITPISTEIPLHFLEQLKLKNGKVNYKIDGWYEKFLIPMILFILNNHICVCTRFAAV